MSTDYHNHENRRFFGRRLTKKLSEKKIDILSSAKDSVIYDVNDLVDRQKIDFRRFFQNDFTTNNIILEIGFGGGEHLLHQAKRNPQNLYIGCDAFMTGVAKTVAQITSQDIKNLYLFHGDALHLLKHIEDNSIDGIYLLYPDPWPKKRHRKRRFIQQDTLAEFARIMRGHAFWRFASDIEDYIEWVFAQIHLSDHFKLNHLRHYTEVFPDWISTRYEQKAFKEGRKAYYFEFFKYFT
ncbi:MAG: tRNA (guanosine(46)-N7)-methyltransferase TrmB [Pseudomonadota bacterium]